MTVRFPAYYEAFRCLAGSCPHSCCRLWDIDIDPATEKAYQSLPGQLGKRIRGALSYENGTAYIRMEGGKCPLWQDDGLCAVQAALGHGALCRTCREFPRLTHDYGTFTEYDLELSCPEAARLIFENVTPEMRSKEVPGGDAPEYDENSMKVLLRTREEALSCVADLSVPMAEVLKKLLLYGYGAEEELETGEKAVMGEEIALPDLLTAGFSAVVRLFSGLEILTEEWKDLLAKAKTPAGLERFRPVLTYFIRRYWLQAVSDGDVVCRVKFMIASCLLLSALPGEPSEITCLFSKEVENDSENMDAVLDGAFTHPAMTDVNLLKILEN